MLRTLARTGIFVLLCTVLLFGSLLAALPAAAGAPAAALAQAATPTPVVTEPLLEWALSDPMLYWADRCFPGPDRGAADAAQGPYLLRRKPLNGGATRTLDTSQTADCLDYRYMTADANAVYYYNGNENSIQSVPLTGAGQPPITLAENVGFVTTELMATEDFIFYGTTGAIRRVPIGGGGAELVANIAGTPRDLALLGNRLYWIEGSGIYVVELPCNSCTPIQYSDDTNGAFLVAVEGSISVLTSGIYWVIRGTGSNQPDRIRTQEPVINGVQDVTVYTGPAGASLGDLAVRSTGFLQRTTYLYWTENRFDGVDHLRRKTLGDSPAEVLAEIDGTLHHEVRIHSGDVYFARLDPGAAGIYRLSADADALTRDARAASWEVTQSIQNLETGVPLVADKPTFVRLYADQIDGPLKGHVEAWLQGERNGVPLLGSPLAPVNGLQLLETGSPHSRTGTNEKRLGWIFRLPGSWDDVGSLTLHGTVDPRQSFTDPNRSNNQISTTVTFDKQADPCLFVWPVETHAPMPHHSDPAFWQTIDRLESLWPVDQVDILWVGEPIRELEACWDWDLHCWGPWELDQGWELTNFPPDKDRLIFKLMLRHAISTVESIFYCEDFASVHTVGMVHGDSNTGGTSGFANFLIGASWVKFEEINPNSSKQWNQPTSGATLAQELTHNFWRYHIGCRDEEDSFFGLADWPYADRCVLDDRPLTAPSTHVGFDPLNRSVIGPMTAGDFMTYRFERWVSDVTAKDVHGILDTIFDRRRAALAVRPTTAHTDEEKLLITGVYEATADVGRIFYTYVLSDTMSSVPTTGERPQNPALHHGNAGRDTPEEPHASLRLRGVDGTLLAEHALELIPPDSHHTDYLAYSFITETVKPAEEVGRIELVVEDRVVDTRIPSANRPTVEIVSPEANAELGDEITLRWRAADADGDELLFAVVYSPDDRLTWLPLTADYPGDTTGNAESAETTLTLQSPETLPGSQGNNAYLRVIASDGYHTAVDEVGPFNVADRAPLAAVQSPHPEAWFDAGDAIPLRGRGYDAESGVMADDALAWTLNDNTIGSGRRQWVVGLAPGTHAATLRVTDGGGQSNSASVTFHVQPLSVPAAQSTPSMDGRCTETLWADAATLPLPAYEGGGLAAGSAVRRGDDLWICVEGLARSSGDALSRLSLYLDTDKSADALAQSDDYRFSLVEDGTPSVAVGDGAGAFTAGGPNFSAEMASVADVWSAEFHIPGAGLDLWQDGFAMALEHLRSGETTANTTWPIFVQVPSPTTWAEVAADAIPFLEGLSPISTTVGMSALTVTLDGRRFTEDTLLQINGEHYPTAIESSRRISATLAEALLAEAGHLQITAVTTSTGGAVSNALQLTVYNPTPEIYGVAPAILTIGTPTTIVITGQNFIPGAVVQWDGRPQVTRWLNEQTLEADLPAAALSYARGVGVTVLNPQPRLQASNAVAVLVRPRVLYLPRLDRE